MLFLLLVVCVKLTIVKAARNTAVTSLTEQKKVVEQLQADLSLANQRLQNLKSTNQVKASLLSIQHNTISLYSTQQLW